MVFDPVIPAVRVLLDQALSSEHTKQILGDCPAGLLSAAPDDRALFFPG
jgi:hypothetical protein